MGVDIQGKLRLALGSVKDHASIGKAMIMYDGFSNIEIAVLKATAHDNGSIDDKYMHEILFLVSNSPGSIPFLAEKLSRRLHKTKDRLVALKTLVLIHRLLRGGNHQFEQELCRAHFSGHLQIGMAMMRCFNSDHFLHKYASYLEERMNWVINQAGKLEPIMSKGLIEFRRYDEKCIDMVFRTLPKCQVLLDRVLDCDHVVLPYNDHNQYGFITQAAAMSNTLRESFQVYTTFAEGVGVLVNMLFDLTESARGLACEILRKASIQSQKLHDLYQNCKQILEINNKNLEYPCVQIISMDHIMALDQCLRNGIISKAPSSDQILQVEKVAVTTAKGKRKNYNKNSNVEEKNIDINLTPSTFFSWTLETKISKVWVVFDQDETFASNQSSHEVLPVQRKN